MAYDKEKALAQRKELLRQMEERRAAKNAANANKPKLSKGATLKKHMSTLVILGLIVVMIVVYMIQSSVSAQIKYDVYDLDKSLNYSKMSQEDADFFKKIAAVNASLAKYSGDNTDYTGFDYNYYGSEYDDILNSYDATGRLSGVQAAEMDLIYLSAVYISTQINNEKNGKEVVPMSKDAGINDAIKKLSAKIDTAVK